ncbi:Uncharacterized protein Adt_10676 [Abeliophyllum distichum]|uniref:DUF4408 domain-containing protein n=1 Tax=Abeliophyllum distichum TaxID=126358 RepID=A0ABD1UL45_9LAMI
MMFEESASAIPSIWASMNSWFTPTVLFVVLNLMIGTIALSSTLANKKQHRQQLAAQPHNHHQPPAKLDRSQSVLQRLKSINIYSFYRSNESQNFTTILKKITDAQDALHNLEQNHQPQNLETQSQYFFSQPHQENFQENIEQQDNIFHQTHQETPQENQTHQETPQENQTHKEISEENELQSIDEVYQTHISEENELQSEDEVYSQLAGNHFSRTKSDTVPASGGIPARLPAKMKKSASVKSAFGHFKEDDIVEAKRPATVREKGSAKITEVAPGDDEVDAKADDFINRFKQQLKLQRLDSIIRYKDIIRKRTG